MTIAFEAPNLAAGVAAVQREAAGQRLVIAGRPLEPYDSADAAQVQAFLLQHAQDAFSALQGAVTPGLIVRVPYRGLGIVFEPAPDEHSPALVPANVKPRYLAVVWQML